MEVAEKKLDPVEKSMEIIANGGEGKSYAMTSIQQARAGKYEEAKESLKNAKESILKSHLAHSELLFYDANHQDLQLSLLMVHAADHLTGADIIQNLAEELIYMYKEMRKD